MRVAVAGASGLIGTALSRHLRARGDEVLRLVRRPAARADEISWDPGASTVDVERLDGVDAVVHLAAVGARPYRWTEAFKAEFRDSRINSTRTLATGLARLDRPPGVFVVGSAIGIYGDAGDHVVDEASPRGEGFFADVVEDWEAAADPARAAEIRVVHARSGLVVAPRGGAWARMWPIFAAGLGGRLGSGEQWWSFVSLRDEVAALVFLLDRLEGPVNITAPQPATNAEVTAAMGAVLRRPTVVPVPAFALRTLLGEFSAEILDSKRVLPTRLAQEQFVFQDPTIADAVRWAWSQRRGKGS